MKEVSMSDETLTPNLSSPPPSPSRLDWLRRRFLKLPIWAWIVIVLLDIGAGTSSGSSSDDDPVVIPEGTEAAAATDVPTTDAPRTTEGPTTTTTPPLSAGDQRDLEVIMSFTVFQEGDARMSVIEEIEDNFILERVDVFTVDVGNEPGATNLRIEGSSGYGTAEYQIEQVWELVDYLGELWASDGIFRNKEGVLKTGLLVVVDGRQYLADYDLMVRAAERNITQSDWLTLASRS